MSRTTAFAGAAAALVGLVVLGGGSTQTLVVPAGGTPVTVPGVDGPVGPAWERVPAAFRGVFFTAGKQAGCALATPALLAGVAEVESGFNPRAVSPAGAQGLFQIMPNTRAAAGITDPFDPAQAAVGAARVLCKKEAATRYHPSPPLVRALAAYNGGEGRVRRGRPIPADILGYAEKVIAASEKYDTPAPAVAAPGGNAPPPPAAAGGKRASMGYQAQERIIKAAFPDVQITSRFRPGSITVTGNLSYHARGRALDLSPRMDVFNWIAKNYPDSAELIFTPAGGRQLKNGKSYVYPPSVARGHLDHIHWAMWMVLFVPLKRKRRADTLGRATL